MARSNLSIELEKMTKRIILHAQLRLETRFSTLNIDIIEREMQIRMEKSFRDSDHSLYFSELIENLFSFISIEKFIVSEDKKQYEKILSSLTNIMIRHYTNKDRFIAPSINCQITLLEWIDGTPGSFNVKKILQPLFEIIYESMAGDRIHPYERYKDIKILAHKLGLHGSVRFETRRKKIIEVDLEGYDVSYTFEAIIFSLNAFLEEHEDILQEAEINLLKKVIKSINLGHQAKRLHLEEEFALELEKHYQTGNPLVLTSGVHRHSMNYIMDNDTLVSINRGFQAEPGKYGSIIYKIGNQKKITATFIREVVVASNATKDDHHIRMEFLKEGLKTTLQVEEDIVHHHSAKKQKVGNCTWANIKEMFRILLAVLHKKTNSTLSWPDAIAEMQSIYKGWSKWDRTFALKNFIEKYKIHHMISDTEKSFLKIILTQKYDVFKRDELERAQFIIKCLGSEEVLSFVEEVKRNLKKMPSDFNFDSFVSFIEKCSHVHAKEVKGTLDLSTELMKIHSSYMQSLESQESAIKGSKSLEDFSHDLLSPKTFLTFRNSTGFDKTPCGCQKHCIVHEEERPKFNRRKSAVF